MNKSEEFKLLKIQTVILKVHIHCDGCKQQVKKLLQRIEGVYTVSIDAEHQKVTVSGDVDSNTLIKKLARSGKHAEVWPQKTNNQSSKPNQQQQQGGKDGNKNNKGQGQGGQANQALIQGLREFKNQHNRMEPLSSDDEEFDDDFDEEEDDELGFLGEKMKQLNISKQANNAVTAATAAGAKKNGGNNNIGGGKKVGGNPNQAIGLKGPNGSEPKGSYTASDNKMVNGAPLCGGNQSAVAGPPPPGLGGSHGLGLHQAQQQPGATFPAGFPANGNGGFGVSHQQSPLMMNLQGQGYQNQTPSTMMNLRGINHSSSNNMLMNESRYMQPQVMYNRSPQIPPYTAYYYPCPYYQSPYVSHHHSDTGLSDENTSSCVVM
ncbi:unnamed protein product [Musa acuminata subsp. malaccensis]|uniref:(wild Malaysian banana) hypothetical protein n=1 Tax=Musa acuminata subsp. malaccensis TaxID=214687 RepID=A0A804HUU9_MUSAM|nr:PREDICTED: uncharacterized protein LOC103990121 [Musa acuminata subsp. malaccensis]CAG1859718.1 unnamed protein product [Musa acuminata subsp. malaccensis]